MSKLKCFLIAGMFSLLGSSVFAQSCDPWIVSIYKQLYNRQPTAQECNIRNYNNGSWSSYQQLTDLIKGYQSSNNQSAPAGDPWIIDIYKKLYNRAPNASELKVSNYNNGSWSSYQQLTELIKDYQNRLNSRTAPAVAGDPWIIDIYKKVYGRSPNAAELRISNYNNGRWSSYEELKGYIQQYQNSLRANNIRRERPGAPGNGSGLGGNVIAPGGANVVSPGGGNVVSPGGANVVSPGGANVVSPGGANVVSPGGGNVVSPGGGN